MLCKASVMGDYESFDSILHEKQPDKVKSLGRKVTPFVNKRWDAVVLEVAREVVTQKFESVPGLAPILLSTGERLIAEMSERDTVWATGLDIGHKYASIPTRWKGINVLGWALMMARDHLEQIEITEKKDPIEKSFEDLQLSLIHI